MAVDDFLEKEAIGKGLTFQYAYYAVLTLSGAAFYLYATHFFPTAIVGSVALLLAIVGIFPVVFSLGLPYGWQHFVSFYLGERDSDSIRRLARKAIKTAALLAASAVLVLFLTAPYISLFFFHTFTYTRLVLLLGLDIPFSIMISALNGLMLGLQKFRQSGTIGMTYVVIVYGTAVVLLRLTGSLDAIPIGWGIGYATGVLLYCIALSKLFMRKSEGRVELGTIFRYSVPLYATGILSFGAAYVDRLTVAFLKDLSSIGVYTLVLLIVSGTGLLSTPIGSVIFSKFSEFYARKDMGMIREGVRISSNAAAVLYVPAALGVSALSIPLLRVLGGPAYLAGSIPLTIILAVNSVFVVGGSLSSALQGTRKTIVFILSASSALLSNLILSIILIPPFSLIGASIGYASINAVSFLVVYYFAREAGFVHFDIRMLSRVWTSAIVMAAIVYSFAWLTGFLTVLMPLYVLTGIVGYFAMLRLTAAVSEADRQLLMSLIPRGFEPLKHIVELL